jgi:hypothetical protein
MPKPAVTLGCRACHELPADQWCAFHERTLRQHIARWPLCLNCGQAYEQHERFGACLPLDDVNLSAYDPHTRSKREE